MRSWDFILHIIFFINKITLVLISLYLLSYKAAITISIFLFISYFLFKIYMFTAKVRSENNQTFEKIYKYIETFRAIQDIKIYNKEKYVQKNFMKM